MKRLISLLILVTYMASAIGFSFSLHYCGGHFKSVCFTKDTEKDCCGKSEHKTNCCHDKVITAKVKDDHSSSVFSFSPKIFIADAVIGPRFVANVISTHSAHDRLSFTDSSPPKVPGIPVFLKNRVLRI